MNALNRVARPKGFKSLALAGVLANTFSLAILCPMLIYLEYSNPEKIAILGIISLLSWFIFLPLTIMLLIGSLGLLFRQYWSRSLCLWALTADLIFGICYTVVDTSIRVANWNDETIFALTSIPIMTLLYLAEGGVIFYLNRRGVEHYLKQCRDSANEL